MCPGAHGISLLRRLNEEKQIEQKNAEVTEETEIRKGDDDKTLITKGPKARQNDSQSSF